MSDNFKNFRDWQPFKRNEAAGSTSTGAGKPGEQSSKAGQTNRGPKEFVEEVKVSGQNLISEVERILREGEVRRLRIKQKDKVLLDIPVAFAAIGALLAPYLAALGGIAAVVSDCTIEVVRSEDAVPAAQPKKTPGSAPGTKGGRDIPTTPDDLSYR